MTPPPSQKTTQWHSDDAISLRTFLESITGQRLLLHVSENCPELLGSGDVNSILIRSGEVKGHSSAIAFIVSLTVETPESITPVKSAFPDLDDESAWDSNNNPR